MRGLIPEIPEITAPDETKSWMLNPLHHPETPNFLILVIGLWLCKMETVEESG